MALLRCNYSACVACHTKRHRREVWLGRTQGCGDDPTFVLGNGSFPKRLQNIDNVLQHKYIKIFVQSVRIPMLKRPISGRLNIGWGVRAKRELFIILYVVFVWNNKYPQQ